MQQIFKKPSLVTLGAIGLLFLAVVISARRTEAQFASPVNVMNSSAAPANVRDADQGARHPFQAGGPNGTSCGGTPVMTVPQHQEAVIELASFSGEAPPNISTDLTIGVTQSGILGFHHLFLNPQGPSQNKQGLVHFIASQPLRLYADPGTDILFAACAGGTSLQFADPTVSGYFVSVP
jgi:hypothetical protein